MKLWHGLGNLDNDPHPAVAVMSQKVTNHIRRQVTYYYTEKKYLYVYRLSIGTLVKLKQIFKHKISG